MYKKVIDVNIKLQAISSEEKERGQLLSRLATTLTQNSSDFSVMLTHTVNMISEVLKRQLLQPRDVEQLRKTRELLSAMEDKITSLEHASDIGPDQARALIELINGSKHLLLQTKPSQRLNELLGLSNELLPAIPSHSYIDDTNRLARARELVGDDQVESIIRQHQFIRTRGREVAVPAEALPDFTLAKQAADEAIHGARVDSILAFRDAMAKVGNSQEVVHMVMSLISDQAKKYAAPGDEDSAQIFRLILRDMKEVMHFLSSASPEFIQSRDYQRAAAILDYAGDKWLEKDGKARVRDLLNTIKTIIDP